MPLSLSGGALALNTSSPKGYAGSNPVNGALKYMPCVRVVEETVC